MIDHLGQIHFSFVLAAATLAVRSTDFSDILQKLLKSNLDRTSDRRPAAVRVSGGFLASIETFTRLAAFTFFLLLLTIPIALLPLIVLPSVVDNLGDAR